MKAKRKIISALLMVMMVAGFMPQATLAAPPQDTGKAIQLGTGGISDYNGGYDYIYFGNWNAPDGFTTTGPIKWRVLDTKSNTGGSGLFLLSEALYGTGPSGEVKFNNEQYDGNAWQGSRARAWCNSFYTDSFSEKERGAVLPTTKSDGAYSVANPQSTTAFVAVNNILNNDKVFFLSAEEAKNASYGMDDHRSGYYGNDAQPSNWWLRSPVRDRRNQAGLIDGRTGDVVGQDVIYENAARPAFNLNPEDVLFISAAKDVKGGYFEKIADYNGNEWKLTLLDRNRRFQITEEAISVKTGDTVELHYTGATRGDNEYISAFIADKDGVQSYGVVSVPTGRNGNCYMSIPKFLESGTYTLYMFNEACNGDYQTDYSSALDPIIMTVSDGASPIIKDIFATRESESTATVTFTADEAGEYYYVVTDVDAVNPDIDTSGAGIPYDTTEQTISLTNLKGAGKKRIHLVFKDAAGNVSVPYTTRIPLHPVYSIAADSSALTFESATEGYQAAPAAQTVTITNTGNQDVTLTQPQATDFNIGTLSATELAAGETATFTVQPKDGLAVGAHNETLTISGSNGVSASVALTFEVTARPVPPVTPPSKPTYPPTVPEAEGGDVSVGPARPNEGDTVTVTPKPKEGMVVDKIIVTDKDGNKIEVTQKPNGDFTFEQPNGKVIITVTFKPVAPSELPFGDVPEGAWYEDAVRYVYENGLIMGVSANEFAPNMTTDRAQLVTMLWRLAGEPQAENSTGFGDVPSNAYYAKAVAWAAENGITAGFEDGTFRPTTGLSREQMAALFMKVAAHSGIDTTARADISGFTDVKPDSWSANALSWAKAVGLLNGVADDTMAPQDTATRAQIAAVLQRYCETVAK